MGIQYPKIHLSRHDKRLLVFIAELLLEYPSDDSKTNIPSAYVGLSDKEADKLLDLLEALLKNPDFIESRKFIKGISSLGPDNDKTTRSIYATGLKQREQSTIITHHRWYELQARLGLKKHSYMGKDILPMRAEYFFKMEERLFEELKFDPRVIALLMKLGKDQSQIIEKFQKSHYQSPVDISESVKRLQKEVKNEKVVSRINLSSVAFVISNSAVLFTTRDWSAAGVFSCMIGNAVSSIKEKQAK
ncbi:hypothetical protein [Micavibrio aeruginosavorus]|uniref:hypothetical protein n=1 Tax=Micavibrio aeruginosavorus TaxID=349221 RepID=UPI003F4AA317